MRSNDPAVVAADYSTEQGLEGRRRAYRYLDGPDVPGLAFAAVAETAPRRVLEVGPGPGELAARIAAELGAEVVAIDSSPRMVELAQSRGVDARLGDVQDLPLPDGAFDCAVAAWMLYHVPDVDRALSELARVLRPGGRLVAVTNHVDHLQELRDLVGLPPRLETPFDGTNGPDKLRRHFAALEVREAGGTVRFPDRSSVLDYIRASSTLFGAAGPVGSFDVPFCVRARPVIFVATKA